MNWIDIKNGLPDLDSTISRSLLMLIDGEEYCGYYHCNGFFYCSEYGNSFLANALPTSHGPIGNKQVTHWRYLRSEK